MALHRAEGFFHFDNSSDWAAKGHSAGANTSWHPTSGRGGRGAVEVGLNSTVYMTQRSAQQTTFVHVAIFTTSRDNAQLIAFRSATHTNVYLQVQGDGSIALQLCSPPFSTSTGPVFPTVGTSTIAVTDGLGIIRNNTWHHLQIKCKVHASSGEFILKVDGVEQLNYSGNTYNGAGGLTTNLIGMGSNQGVSSVWYSDLVTNDDQTVDYGDWIDDYDDFLGDLAVYESVDPTDGDYTEWDRSSGAGTWSSHVNENPQDEDATYLETDVDDDRISFLYPTVSSAIGTIIAIKETVCHRKDEPSTAIIKLFTRSDDNIDHDVDTLIAATEDYKFDEQIWAKDPKDGTDWSAAKVNATELGVVNITSA